MMRRVAKQLRQQWAASAMPRSVVPETGVGRREQISINTPKPAPALDVTPVTDGSAKLLKGYLLGCDFPFLVRHSPAEVAAVARTLDPRTLKKVRRWLEGHRQWITGFFAALG